MNHMGVISIVGFSAIGNETLQALTKIRDLRSLTLKELPAMTGANLSIEVNHLLNLWGIDFSYLKFSDSVIRTFAQACIGLTSITLKYCDNITDVSMAYIATYCNKLRRFSLDSLPGVYSPEHIYAVYRSNASIQGYGLHIRNISKGRICDNDDDRTLLPEVKSQLDVIVNEQKLLCLTNTSN